LLRLATLLVTFVFLGGTAAQAATQLHSLTGNARIQIGNGLPIPIVASGPPTGGILAVPGAVVAQTTGLDPKNLTLLPNQLTAPGNVRNVGVFLANPALFEVATFIPINMPGLKATLSAGGRTGASTVTFCPGSTVSASGNPACVSVNAGTINGLMRYTRTTNQFGGPLSAGGTGPAAIGANVAAIAGGGPPPCAPCTAIFALANVAPTGAQGAAFGFVNGTAPPIPSPSGIAVVGANTFGTITTVFVSNLGAGLPNTATSYGGPFTTGYLTVSVTQNLGATAEVFTLSGSDGRVGGIGTISLVGGAVSNRTLSGPNANRAWLNLTIGAPVAPAPSMSSPGLAAVFGLLALGGGYALWRRARS
jgi:hypothetical protein